MRIRQADERDWPLIYPFFREIVDAGSSYAYPEALSSEDARPLWMGQEHVVVAEEEGSVLGSATMGANRPGRGSHVATGSFMVDPRFHGRGVGRALGSYLLDWACSQGYLAIQFNAVVETNAPAVTLWKSLGFRIVGTVPEAFDHREHGLVGLHVMHRPLGE